MIHASIHLASLYVSQCLNNAINISLDVRHENYSTDTWKQCLDMLKHKVGRKQYCQHICD